MLHYPRSGPVWIAALLALLGASCATRQPIEGRKVSGLDEKYSNYAYIEEGRMVTLIVDTKAARDRDGNKYFPLEIAVANRGLRTLSLSREVFTLVDSNGNRYPMASPQELFQGYPFLEADRNYAELQSIAYAKFAANARFSSNFSPWRIVQNRSNLVRDRVILPKHGYLMDFIYFPMPETGLLDQRFDLFIDAPELEDPVFLSFEIR